MGPGAKTMSFRDKLRLEQERKFGVAPLARDAVTGEELNPNIPEVMTSAPYNLKWSARCVSARWERYFNLGV
jgi:hypothetical protein